MSINAQGQENKLYPAFEDGDYVPFGKYKDEYLRDVPDSY
jgi:hypothetical protein